MTGAANPGLPGIHHVTAICSDPQRNVDIYVGLLGPRPVKKPEGEPGRMGIGVVHHIAWRTPAHAR